MQSKVSVWEDLIKKSCLKSSSISQSKAETGIQMEIQLGYHLCRKTSVMSWSENWPIRKRLSLTAYHQTVWVCLDVFGPCITLTQHYSSPSVLRTYFDIHRLAVISSINLCACYLSPSPIMWFFSHSLFPLSSTASDPPQSHNWTVALLCLDVLW